MSVADTDRSSYILCEQKDDLHEHGRARIATLQRTMSEGMVNAKSIWLVGRSQTRSPRAAQRVGRSNGKRLYQQKHERKSLKKENRAKRTTNILFFPNVDGVLMGL